MTRHKGNNRRLPLAPDVRDGLTREERLVLYVLHRAQKERGDRNVPTPLLWGRVCEYFYISPEDLSEILARLGARWCSQSQLACTTDGINDDPVSRSR
jgi:hypothetical protein